ncbi:MAG: VOC family protein [Rhizobiaceae bacterium]
MNGLELVLDHLALVVPDLDRANEIYQRMGFNLSPRSSHKGKLVEGGPVELWGAGNHCAMFEQGYFEILGITDVNLHNDHVQVLLDSYTGLHLIALGCQNANEAATILTKRLGSKFSPYEVGRDVPCANGETLPGKFNILHLPEGIFDEADLFCIEHLTPDALWQTGVIDQPNGVIGLVDVLICSNDLKKTNASLSHILEKDFETDNSIASFQLTRGQIRVTDPAGLIDQYPGITAPVLPWVAAMHFAVKDVDQTRRYLNSQGFTINNRGSNQIWIEPSQCEGAIVVFSSRAD